MHPERYGACAYSRQSPSPPQTRNETHPQGWKPSHSVLDLVLTRKLKAMKKR